MGIFATLHNEHVLIQRHLELLKRASNRVVDNKPVPREFFENVIAFARMFNDKHHHYKEELLLFAYMAQKYEGRLDATLEKLRSQHEMARDHINGVADMLNAYERGESDPTRQLGLHLSEFIRLMEVHLFSEDMVFFRMAKEMLSEEEQDALQKAFTKYEQKQGENPTVICTRMLDQCERMLEIA
ncbi:hemerythrin domain-containing protein [bacterium]|nr:hemerythrin domain-containing protein [bacterium]